MSNVPLSSESVVQQPPLESEDLDAVREQPPLISSATSTLTDPQHTHPFFLALEALVNLISSRFEVDRQQVYLGLILSSVLFFLTVFTHIAWRIYSPVIAEFSLREENEKARKQQQADKEKVVNASANHNKKED